MQIALGSAKGLAYLHNVAQPPVIYRDLKTANILLDHGYKPKGLLSLVWAVTCLMSLLESWEVMTRMVTTMADEEDESQSIEPTGNNDFVVSSI